MTSQEVNDIAGLAKNTRSPGPDSIDPLVAKQTIVQVAGIFSEVINSSFETGIVQLALKTAKLIPLFKQGNKLDMTNYRPISILPYFAKIIEKAMSNRMTKFIEDMSLLYPHQFGFRIAHSTDMH